MKGILLNSETQDIFYLHLHRQNHLDQRCPSRRANGRVVCKARERLWISHAVIPADISSRIQRVASAANECVNTITVGSHPDILLDPVTWRSAVGQTQHCGRKCVCVGEDVFSEWRASAAASLPAPDTELVEQHLEPHRRKDR